MTEYQNEFLRELAPALLAAQERYGLPASAVLAQAILESDWGRSELARKHKNFFGIKAPSSAKLRSVEAGTREYEGGEVRRVRARFASYASVEECVEAYARILSLSRYLPARQVAKKPFAFVRALQRCGYATDPRYARKLELIIRRYRLEEYDGIVAAAAAPRAEEIEST